MQVLSFITRVSSLAARQMTDLLALDAVDGAIEAGRLQEAERPAALALAHFADLCRSAITAASVEALSTEEMQALSRIPPLTHLDHIMPDSAREAARRCDSRSAQMQAVSCDCHVAIPRL